MGSDSLESLPVNFGLYVHVPFCEQHCHYCAFAVSLEPASEYGPYVGRLVRELELAGLAGSPRTVYFGGGTPSLLGPDLFSRLAGAVGPGSEEVTIEANPGTLDGARLETWRRMGVNRVSLGAQSFDSRDLECAGRLHSTADTLRDYELLVHNGFENINLDLIAGLPGQERRAWLENLEWIDRLGPAHVSLYLLEREESSVWARQPPLARGDDDYAWFYEAASDRLGATGYLHYEVSSWARTGSECVHNRGYWNGTAYRGVGLGAHSFLDNHRFWNTRSMRVYAEQLDAGQLPLDGSEWLSPRMRLEEAFLLGLRQMVGFDVSVIAGELGFQYPQEWFDRLNALERAGLVEFDDPRLRLAPRGWLLTSSITEELLCPSLLSICEATR
jgi:oxygen-independent coproporphyrinogen-3 oxidase